MVQPTAAASATSSDVSPTAESASVSPAGAPLPTPAATVNGAERIVKKRQRATLSCTACRARKQSCNRQVPCNRCIDRGAADSCQIDVKVKSSAAARAGPAGRTSDNQEALINRIARLEAALREARCGQQAAATATAVTEDVQDAAAALGELAQSTGGGGEGFSQWQAAGSVASLLRAKEYADVGPGVGDVSFQLPPEQIAKLLSAFPPRSLADALVDRFYSEEVNSLLQRYVITRRDTFQRTYEQLLAYKDDIDLFGFYSPLPTSLASISFVSIVLATGLQFSDPTTIQPQYLSSDLVKLEENLHDQAKRALDMSEVEEPPSLFRVEASLYLAIYSKNSGRPNANYFILARAIRSAQQMGMHREGAHKWRMRPYEAEQRRRLWWALYAYDKQSSFAYSGRPCLINDLHCDTQEPANADLRYYDETSISPIVSRPIEEPTPYTVNLMELRCAKLVGKISDRIFTPAKHTYADIVDADRQLVELENGFPLSFRSPSLAIIQQCPWVVRDFETLSLHLTWLRCLLHRPYLLKPVPSDTKADYFAGSRQLAISLSQKMISVARYDVMRLTKAQIRFFMFPFRLFDSAANLALANLQQPSSANAVRTNDRWILEARSGLEQMAETSTVAAQAVRCIDALRQRVADSLPDGVELAGPLIPVGAGPHVVPYTGSTLSFDRPPTAKGAAATDAVRSIDSDSFTLATPSFVQDGNSAQPSFALPSPTDIDLSLPALDAMFRLGAGPAGKAGPASSAAPGAMGEDWMNWESTSLDQWPITASALQGPNEWEAIWATIEAGL